MTGNSPLREHARQLEKQPQWSPVDVTGNRVAGSSPAVGSTGTPQWSPVDVTGNSRSRRICRTPASTPQWSPVDVTGNRRGGPRRQVLLRVAAMEPGRRDREQDIASYDEAGKPVRAAMEPGRRDREQARTDRVPDPRDHRRNGARST